MSEPQTIIYTSANGKERTWTIEVVEDPYVGYRVTHGEVGGALQTQTRRVTGKNVGKANETSARAQAEKEAATKYKLKLSQVERTECPLPMLAQEYAGKHIEFPCFVQPKLNGVRGIYDPVRKQIYSRLGNDFPHLQHILTALKDITIPLDGELYCTTMPFETLVGLVKKKTYNAQILEVKFHVFDCVVPEISFEDRLWLLDQVFDQSLARTVDLAPDTVRRVETRECQSEEYIPSLLEAQLIEGYEGIMLRNKAAPYVHKRTHDLQKVKKFVDAEFEIVGYERENNAARSIVWSCRTASGRSFAARPTGVLASRSLTDKVARAQVGKMLTVKYQELTAHGVPRFPVGIAVRDYE